ncbi:MAG: hypothetical protein IT256_08830 [Chitinophagaceae bacterium]|nr:hypothetical protein [Chitinophagaceae bacterium]
MRARAISKLNDKIKKLTPEQITELERMAGEMGGKDDLSIGTRPQKIEPQNILL